MKYRTLLLAITAAAVFAAAAHAHKVCIFAEVYEDQVIVQAYFSPGSVPVKGGKIIVKDPGGNVLFEGTTDDEGYCAFAPIARIDLEITVNAGTAHISKPFVIRAEELTMFDTEESPTKPEPAPKPAPEPEPEAPENTQSEPSPEKQSDKTTTAPERKKIVQEKPRHKFTPEERKAKTDNNDDEIRLRDILGGLGWIVGLTGIAMYVMSRRRKGGGQDVSR